MKRIAFLGIMIFFLFGVSASADYIAPDDYFLGIEETKKEPVSICPKTRMSESCLACHVIPDFGLIEANPDRHRSYPSGYNIKIVGDTCKVLVKAIDGTHIERVLDYIEWHPEVKKIVIEVHSNGGSVMEAWRMIGLLESVKNKYAIETRVFGVAASAGFMLFCVGDVRLISPTAELMIHELWTFKMFSFETPSSKEDEAKILRHLQDTIIHWIAERSTIEIDDLNTLIRKKEYWLNGREAKDIGFATGFSNK